MSNAYVRYKEDLPDNSNSYAAAEGFQMLGYHIVPFYGFGDVPVGPDLLDDSVVAGMIGDVWASLTGLGKSIPEALDYPSHLRSLMGRNVSQSTLGEVKKSTTRVFIKPVKQKLFTGRVWDHYDRGIRLSLATYEDSTPVWTSDPVFFVSEYRAFVLDDVLLDVRHYKGDWAVAPNRGLVESAVASGRGIMPRAYSIDVGIDLRGWTLLVEVNDAYALGSYGLNSTQYARMIEARWRQLTS